MPPSLVNSLVDQRLVGSVEQQIGGSRPARPAMRRQSIERHPPARLGITRNATRRVPHWLLCLILRRTSMTVAAHAVYISSNPVSHINSIYIYLCAYIWVDMYIINTLASKDETQLHWSLCKAVGSVSGPPARGSASSLVSASFSISLGSLPRITCLVQSLEMRNAVRVMQAGAEHRELLYRASRPLIISFARHSRDFVRRIGLLSRVWRCDTYR